MSETERQLRDLVAAIRAAADSEEAEAIGRGGLASFLHAHAGDGLDPLLKLAKKEHRVGSALAAARHYCGLPAAVCERIDAVTKAPFAAASGPARKGTHRRR